MATRKAVIGTGAALTGLAGLGVAAVSVGAPDSTTPLQPAADTVETQTQTQVVQTVEHRTKRLKAHRRHDGRTVVRAADDSSGPGPALARVATATTTTPTTTVQSDDGPNHDVNDDHGGREQELGDDRGGRELEAGDDHGGDDRGEAEDHSGPGGGGDDDRGESRDD